jgi:hypothetical protein
MTKIYGSRLVSVDMFCLMFKLPKTGVRGLRKKEHIQIINFMGSPGPPLGFSCSYAYLTLADPQRWERKGTQFYRILFCLFAFVSFWYMVVAGPTRGRILGEIQTKVSLFAIQSHLFSFAYRFLFLQNHATS